MDWDRIKGPWESAPVWRGTFSAQSAMTLEAGSLKVGAPEKRPLHRLVVCTLMPGKGLAHPVVVGLRKAYHAGVPRIAGHSWQMRLPQQSQAK